MATTTSVQPVVRSASRPALSAFANVYHFTGRRFDGQIGLYYYRNRFYDPRSGRFISRDPLGYVDGMNLYEYVQSSPPNNVDPLGQDACKDIIKRTEENRDKLGKDDMRRFFIDTQLCILYKVCKEGCCVKNPKWLDDIITFFVGSLNDALEGRWMKTQEDLDAGLRGNVNWQHAFNRLRPPGKNKRRLY